MEVHFLAVVETREIQNGGNESQQVVLTLSDASQVAQLQLVEGPVNLAFEQLCITEYRLQWRAELVA